MLANVMLRSVLSGVAKFFENDLWALSVAQTANELFAKLHNLFIFISEG